ncbi:MAG: tRNA (guanosine(37)-N1)-methyltransferase TrmD [Deferribacteraceae bacterium]|jgi:tRNA (guanine37-N1)-methyltransferase|nr:tRNA (guanosine(37)-N1)-methyltransferase TrmD [Deferribacteraceae bacterium]
MIFNVCTIFPGIFKHLFSKGVLSKALEKGVISLNPVDLREFCEDKHEKTDDYQYGGGVGLVMKPEPIHRCVSSLAERGRVILLDPVGERFTQRAAERLSGYPALTFICGRYEGVDERVRELAADEAISVGDFILTGGEFAAAMIIDAVARLLPGVLGDSESLSEESFCGGLEYPHYTRPSEYMGLGVPEVLLGGNAAEIARWRENESLKRTAAYRADLFPAELVKKADENLKSALYNATRAAKGRKLKVALALMHYPMRDKQGDTVCSSITNMDLHDISRTAATFGAERFFVVTPIASQAAIAERVVSHWLKGWGSTYNSNRSEAFAKTEICASLGEAIACAEEIWGEKPFIAATSAKETGNISCRVLGNLAEKKPVLLLFGTGWGFHPSVLELADFILEPICGVGDFNHLSVRSAAALILERMTRAG